MDSTRGRRLFHRPFYGWAIVASASVISFVQITLFNPTLGVFIKPLAAEFGWSRTTIAAPLSLGTILGGLLAPLIGSFLDRRGARLLVSVGGLVTGGALMALAFVDGLWYYYVAYIFGRAANTPVVMMGVSVAVANWFVLLRGRAMALMTTGNRVGFALVPLFTQLMLAPLGWRGAYAVLGGVTLLLTALPAFLVLRRRPEDMGLHPDGVVPEGARAQRLDEVRRRDVSFTRREAASTPAFWLITVTGMAAGLAQGAIHLHVIPYLSDVGLSGNTAAGVFAFYGVVTMVSGLVWGITLERVHVRWAVMGMMSLASVAVVVLSMTHSLTSALAFAVLYGAAVGGWMVAHHMVMAEYFGRTSLGAIRGLATPLELAAHGGGPLLAAWVFDTRGSYALVFTIFIGTYLVASTLMALARPPKRVPAAVGAGVAP